MQQKYGTSDEEVMAIGLATAGAIMRVVNEMLEAHPRSAHIALIAFVHAAVHQEVFGRRITKTPSEHRADFMAIINSVMDSAERELEALK